MYLDISKIPEYKQAMRNIVYQRYDDAEKELAFCINLAKQENAIDSQSFFIRTLGNLFFEKGEVDKAISYYLEAENIDNTLYSTYKTASFFAERLKDYQKAIIKCDEIIKEATEHPHPESENDFASRDYLAWCHALQGYCYCQLDRMTEANEKLLLLFEFHDVRHIYFDIPLCELFLEKQYEIENVKKYLENVLSKILARPDHAIYQKKITHLQTLIVSIP